MIQQMIHVTGGMMHHEGTGRTGKSQRQNCQGSLGLPEDMAAKYHVDVNRIRIMKCMTAEECKHFAEPAGRPACGENGGR